MSKTMQGWLLCLPALFVFGLFYIGPTIVGLLFSFTNWDGVKPAQFIGLANYIELFSSGRYWDDFVINSLFAAAIIVLEIPLALFLALGLSIAGPGIVFFRTAFFLPQALSITVAALIWRFAYEPSVGLVNRIFEAIGLSSFTAVWLGETDTALAAVTVSFMWWTFGFFTILFIAGLSGIPSMYFEAFRLESDRWYQELRFVTVPLLRETLLIAFAMAISNAFGFAIGYFELLTHGGPAGSTELLGLFASSTALLGRRFGFSSAITMTMLLLVLAIVIGPILYIARERLEYSQ
ncbi:carbohydrate ABC transporter permease [Chloroflexota bacterium]